MPKKNEEDLVIYNEEQKRYNFYAENAETAITQLEASLKLQKELLEFFKKRVIEVSTKNAKI